MNENDKEFEFNEQGAELCEDMTYQERLTEILFENELEHYLWDGERR